MYREINNLPFRKIYGLDFEYFGTDGEKPNIVCMVVQDLRSGDVSRYWQDDLSTMSTPHFETGEDIALVTFFAPAEIQSILALSWHIKVSILDLFAEFRCITNGDPRVGKKSLIGALRFFGLDHLIPDEKDTMRVLILSGGPWRKDQETAILDYCQQDVIALGPLLEAMINRNPWTELQLNQALLRGRYMQAVGFMQHYGIPIDLRLLDSLNANWDAIKTRLITTIDEQYGVYVEGSFKEALFESYLAREGIPWPRLNSGRLALDQCR